MLTMQGIEAAALIGAGLSFISIAYFEYRAKGLLSEAIGFVLLVAGIVMLSASRADLLSCYREYASADWTFLMVFATLVLVVISIVCFALGALIAVSAGIGARALTRPWAHKR